jgi:TPR repeat protein
MSMVEVLYFAADPNSSPQNGPAARLLLDEEARQIREKVRAADHRAHLDFQTRWAVRTDDLLQALRERRPHVVHFSGHGGSEGVILVGRDGRPHAVPAEALARLFTTFKGNIQVVLLNACFSRPQAKAIAEAVGCAIGTRGPISDAAAISFAAAFYSGIAFGESVQVAYDRAATQLALDRISEEECPELVVGDGVDASKLILIPEPAKRRPRKRTVPQPSAGPSSQEPAAPEPGSGSKPGDPPESTRPGTGVQNAGPHKLANLGLMSGPPIDEVERADADHPAPPAGWERRFTAAVWTLSLMGSMLLGTGVAWSLGLSLVSLLITVGLLRYSRSRGSRGAMRRGPAGGVAAMASAAVVLAVSTTVDPDTPLPPQCVRNVAPAPLGLAATSVGDASGEAELDAAIARYEAGDYDAALPVIKRAAEARNSEAMGYLAVAYLCGEGTDRSPKRARPWLNEAKQTRDARGMNALGIAYETGQGQDKSNRWAKHWYRVAADAGYVEAMRNLGVLYLRLQQPDSASFWLDSASRAGSAEAKVDLGRMYEEGLTGAGADTAAAIEHYRAAAAANSVRGMLAMGRIHQAARDYRMARIQYEKAAAAGSADARNNLGVLYQNGWGVPQSRDTAVQLYRQAADEGSAEARQNLAALEGGWRGWLRRWF